MATGYLGSGSIGKDSGAGQSETLTVTGPGQPLCSFKQSSLWMFLLCLGMHGKDQTKHQGWLLPAPGLGSRSAKVPRQREIHVYLPPPAGYVLSSVTEKVSGGVSRMEPVDLR